MEQRQNFYTFNIVNHKQQNKRNQFGHFSNLKAPNIQTNK